MKRKLVRGEEMKKEGSLFKVGEFEGNGKYIKVEKVFKVNRERIQISSHQMRWETVRVEERQPSVLMP